VAIDRAAQAHKRPDYLRLNPNGLIPALVDGDLVLYETAAIALHLCDTHPGAQLVPPLGTRERAHFYKWLMWLTNTLQATLLLYFYPARYVDEGNSTGATQVKAQAERRIGSMLDQLDAELARHGGAWFAGQAYSGLDAYVFTLCRWTRNFASAPARSRPHLGPYLQRMLERSAVRRVIVTEGHLPPLV
jgi:glutathione S-transferase